VITIPLLRGPQSILIAGAVFAAIVTGCAQKPVSATDPIVANVQRGRALFEKSCSNCHGAIGTEGDIGPSLRGESRRKDLDATIVWIHHPQPPMPTLYPSPLTAAEVIDIASYVQTL
jgi:mono/diheme cytochrome c family protein